VARPATRRLEVARAVRALKATYDILLLRQPIDRN